MAAKSKIDFKAIAATALNSADSLLMSWLPHGKREGHEFKSVNPTRGDNKPGSFSINLNTGAWGDFATGDVGGDLISLCAYLFHNGDQGDAVRDVAEQLGIDLGSDSETRQRQPKKSAATKPETEEKKARTDWRHIVPVPADAPEPPVAHYARGRPETIWTYRDGAGEVLGYVYRFVTSDGGKETLPVSFCEHPDTGAREWRWLSFPEPRPLYGLDRLAAKPDAWVLLVEGEKCADAPVDLLPNAVVMSWPGGCKAVDKVDWRPLKGCNVFLWPDCDAQREKLTAEEKESGIDPLSKPLKPEQEQPGMIAMERIANRLLAMGENTRARIVQIPPPGEKPDGWDVYDAIAHDGMDGPALIAMIKNGRVPVSVETPAEDAPKKSRKSRSTPNSATAEETQAGDDDWYSRLLQRRGEIVACMANVFDMLHHSPEWQGVLAFDLSAQCTVKLKPPPYPGGATGEWDDQDDARAAMWLSRRYRISPSQDLIKKTVDIYSRDHSFHPIRDYLTGLQWDGTPRIDHWMADYFGVNVTEYTQKVSRWFLMGMVARAMVPGCKFDYCLVLEGDQGLKKSSILRVLGGRWFGDTDLDLHSKDSMASIRGKWLYEFAEMGSVTRTEASKQKSFISRQVDEFRLPYGTRDISCPRQVVFAGTINEWEWNKDPTGGRRFWPVMILQEINQEGLAAVRDQLFAEAYHAWASGEKYWPTREEQQDIFDKEQKMRQIQDSLTDLLIDWVSVQNSEFSLAYAASECLKIDASKLTRDIQTRIGAALRELGCTKVERRTLAQRYWYKPPERKAVASHPGMPAQQSTEDEDDSIPF